MAKKRRLKSSVKNFFLGIFVLFIFSIVILYFLYQWGLKPVTTKNEAVEFRVESGETYLTIAPKLKKEKLINSELAYKLYIKIHKPTNFRVGIFSLNRNMGVVKLTETLANKSQSAKTSTKIVFPEGKNMRQIAKIISKNTNNKEEEVFEILKDQTYLKELISKYWFLDETILNDKIYYSLEGYLFPDTYEFKNENVTIKDIFETMLTQTEKKLEPYKEDIENGSYTLHEILTLASIVELEAANSDDRAGVAGVFYNRLEGNWSLGSDVTTYYAAKVELSERDLYQSELDDYNDYNTRSSQMAGQLPISPICNPGIEAIEAAIKPTQHDYYYFVADKNKKTYFSKTSSEHDQIIANLKQEGLWYEYQ